MLVALVALHECEVSQEGEPVTGRDSKAGRVERAVLDLLAEHEARGELPTTGRFLFYELEHLGLAAKPLPDDDRPNRRRSLGWPPGSQDVTDALTRLRESGLVPWTWIADEERTLYEWTVAATVADYLLDRLAEATLSPWGDELPPLVLCESNAVASVLRPVAAAYACPIAGTKGHARGFLLTEVAPIMADEDDRLRSVLYLGDLDLAGADIEANARRVLEGEVGPLDWRRVAITEAQAAEHGVEPIRKVDGRSRKAHDAIEVEALGQSVVVALVRETLDALAPEPLARVRERAAAEREEWRARLDEASR